jgi:hypothetical protein
MRSERHDDDERECHVSARSQRYSTSPLLSRSISCFSSMSSVRIRRVYTYTCVAIGVKRPRPDAASAVTSLLSFKVAKTDVSQY